MASHRVQAYAEFFALIKLDGPTQVIQTVFDILLTFATFRAQSLAVTAQIVRLVGVMCQNPHIQSVLLTLESARFLVTRHHTMCFDALLQPHAGRYLTGFYAAVTQLLLVRAPPGDLEQFCLPLLRELETLRESPQLEVRRYCVTLRKLTGVARACVMAQEFLTVYDMLWG